MKDLQSGETVASFHTHAAAVIMFTEYYNTILPLPAQRGVRTEMTECPIPVPRQYNIYVWIACNFQLFNLHHASHGSCQNSSSGIVLVVLVQTLLLASCDQY